MMKKNLIHCLFGLFIFCSVISIASAHTLEIDGEIGVTLHVHPDDEPVAEAPTPFYIDITQRTRQFNLINCQCSLIVERSGEVLATLPVKYLVNPVFTFPAEGLYTVYIVGQPIGAAQFKPFKTDFSYYVRPAPGISAGQVKTDNTLQSFFPYVTLAVSLTILCIVLIPANPFQKGKK